MIGNVSKAEPGCYRRRVRCSAWLGRPFLPAFSQKIFAFSPRRREKWERTSRESNKLRPGHPSHQIIITWNEIDAARDSLRMAPSRPPTNPRLAQTSSAPTAILTQFCLVKSKAAATRNRAASAQHANRCCWFMGGQATTLKAMTLRQTSRQTTTATFTTSGLGVLASLIRRPNDPALSGPPHSDAPRRAACWRNGTSLGASGVTRDRRHGRRF